jgi:hypothetical protein
MGRAPHRQEAGAPWREPARLPSLNLKGLGSLGRSMDSFAEDFKVRGRGAQAASGWSLPSNGDGGARLHAVAARPSLPGGAFCARRTADAVDACAARARTGEADGRQGGAGAGRARVRGGRDGVGALPTGGDRAAGARVPWQGLGLVQGAGACAEPPSKPAGSPWACTASAAMPHAAPCMPLTTTWHAQRWRHGCRVGQEANF